MFRSYPLVILLALQLFLAPVYSQACGKWPDWTPDCGQPACPDCDRIKCIDEITQADCPDGSFLSEKKMFGCCPACVKYQAHGDICPGIDWENDANPTVLRFGEDTSEDLFSYPKTFIQQTMDLPCSIVNISEIYSGTELPMQERVTSVEWKPSRDGSKTIPFITSPQCQPDLICQKIKYRAEDEVGQTKCTPGGAPCFDGNGVVDPWPICNGIPTKSSGKGAGLNEFIDVMDCENQPCTCRALDYKLWAIKQYGEDCSQHFWNPSCDAAGFGLYDAVQFKVSADEEGQYRWCSSPRGDLLYGKEQVTMEDSEMTCTCSLKRWELEQEKLMTSEPVVEARADVSLHCTEEGSFETLQCDKGRCWCVEQKTGDAISIVVPESLIKLLPCFDDRDLPEHYGNQYLRKCENRAISILNTKELLSVHGTQWNIGNEFECDPDGSFAPVQCAGSQCRCYTKNNVPLGAYAVEGVNKGEMSCRCARDESEQLTALTCQGNGDYATLQSSGGQEWCTSPTDGWRISGKVPQSDGNRRCCLDSEYYSFQSILDGHEYPTGGYVFWNPDNRLSYACNQYVKPATNQDANCRPCQEEIMKCQ